MLATNTNSAKKEWSFERWSELATRIFETTDIPLVQIGSPNTKRLPKVRNLCGKLSPREIVYLLSHAQFLISVDSFFLHAGELARVPKLCLWGPTSPAVFGYQSDINIQAVSPCALPCLNVLRNKTYTNPCTEEPFCMESITAAAVFETIRNEVLPKLEMKPIAWKSSLVH